MIYYYSFPLIGEVTLLIKDKALAEFTKRQLGNYFVKETIAVKMKFPIEITYENEECYSILNNFVNTVKLLSRKCTCSDGELIVEDLVYKVKDHKIYIYNRSKNTFQKVKKILKKLYYLTIGNSKEKKYSSLHSEYYKSLFFPICSLYTMLYGFYCIHGSLLQVNSHTIVVSGLDGVGKSSISILLEEAGQGKILSDNCILYNGEYAVPLNCAMRLCNVEKVKYPIIYKAKEFIEVLPETSINNPCKVEKIFNVSIGKELKLTKLNDSHNTELVLFLNGASEINRANRFLSPFLYINMQNERIHKMMGSDLYDVKIPFGKIREGIKVIIDECSVLF